MPQVMPAYATHLLAPQESVGYVTRPRTVRLGMLLALGTIVLALAVFSFIVDPGFIRLASLPAFPLLGAQLGHLIHRPVIFVTDRRVVSASRGQTPLSIDLDRLKAIRLQQSAVERLFGYGSLHLLVQPPEYLGEGAFLRYRLSRLPNVTALASALSTAAGFTNDVPTIVRKGALRA